jgi:hypothetical protein
MFQPEHGCDCDNGAPSPSLELTTDAKVRHPVAIVMDNRKFRPFFSITRCPNGLLTVQGNGQQVTGNG